eukprot:Opistho-1_new@98375
MAVDFPDELWVEVFQRLDLEAQTHLGATCKRLHQISWDSSLAKIRQKARSYFLHAQPLPSLIANQVSLLQLHGQEVKECSFSFFLEQVKKLKRLQKLSLPAIGKGLSTAKTDSLVDFGKILADLPCLQLLDLSMYAIGGPKASLFLEKIFLSKTLKVLALTENFLIDNEAKALAEGLKNHPTLYALNLRKNGIRDGGAWALTEALHSNTRLHILDLSINEITDGEPWGQLLEGNTSLTHLNLSGNFLEDSGVERIARALKKNTSLRYLGLAWTLLGDMGVAALAKALEENRALSHLDLHANLITDRGVSTLATSLQENPTLRRLVLDENKIARGGALALKENAFFTHLHPHVLCVDT